MSLLRALVVALVLANIGLWGWRVQQRTAAELASPPPPPIPASVPRLRLLDELPSPPPPRRRAVSLLGAQPLVVADRVDAAARWAALPPGVDCVRLGPVTDAGRAATLAARARALGGEVRTVREAHHRMRYWWVYLAPQREDAREVVAALRERGVGDVMAVQRGPWRGAVSLGAYRSLASVQRRLAELAAAGQHPLVLPRRFEVAVSWIDVRLSQPSLLSRLRADPALAEAPPEGPCPPPAGPLPAAAPAP